MFVAAFDTLFGGFRNRAQQTFELLQTKETAFLVVAAPEADALREAAYFVERLDAERMPLAGLVVNRATDGARGALGEQAVAAAERLEAATRPERRSDRRRHRRAAAAARRPDAAGRPGDAAAAAVPGRAPARADGGGPGAVHRRARPRRAARVGDLLAG